MISKVSGAVSRSTGRASRNKFIFFFISIHVLFSFFLGRLFAFAPDEFGYLYTFNNLYGGKDANPQLASGWITAPKSFLWVSYLPAKLINLLGVPDFLSLRLLSILLTGGSLYLLMGLYRERGFALRGQSRIFWFFFIPSVFLWTSVGLRESFIIFEMTLILVGIMRLFEERAKSGAVILILGSYGLLSTKSYLWICLAAATILLAFLLIVGRRYRRRAVVFIVASILAPSLLFASTTSWYALEFIVSSVFHTDVTSVGARSGDSIVQVAIPQGSSNNPGNSGSNSNNGNGGSNTSTTPVKPPVIITFHGDSTLIALHFYLIDHPKAPFSRILISIGIAKKIENIWEEKVKSGLIKKSKNALPDTSSLSGYILKPASVHNPLSIFRPAFLFLFGPIPFLDQGGIALNIVTFESPLWWLLYWIVGRQMFRSRGSKFMQDPAILFTIIFSIFLLTFSALVEVNLGTSFRHRSILFIPLIFLYLRLRSKFDSRSK